MSDPRDEERLRDAVARASSWSPFLRLLLEREPAIAAALAAGRLDLAASSSTPDMPVARRLRLDRRALALSVAIGDLAGALDLTAVTHALSDFADRALDTAIRAAIIERTPDAPVQGFAAIALGKQGSRELNYSSDIDPILIFDPQTLPCRPREAPEDAAVRIGRRVVELLQARDGDGYVLRVDLRLRPSPEATPIALPVDAAIGYYESQALPWERAAFIRARAAAGDIALGTRFLAAIRPFIWRRALDFGAVRELRGMSRLIRDHHAQGQMLAPGYDLKRGRGGIREAEFYAQIHQLIHGGRDSSLRAPATRDALAALARAGWIDAETSTALSDGYTLLRTIEHRVQMIDDRQTHTLPAGAALDGVARLHGLADGGALIARLAPRVAAVGAIYDALEEGAPAVVPHDAVALDETLVAAGFADPAAARARLQTWRGGTYPALRSPAAHEALEAALPTLIPAIGGAPDPQAALLRFDALLEHLPSAINLFRLLDARPALARLLTVILSHAAPLAEALGRQPALLDGLIDATAFEDVGDVAALAAEMRGGDAVGYERRLDHVRRVVSEKKFALGVQIVAGTADPLMVSQGYARVAEAAIEVVTAATIAEFAAAHGRVPDSEFAILALGRLGGGQLTHASDLDLIYLFTGDFSAESDGARPLGATLYYNRLAARVTGALSRRDRGGAVISRGHAVAAIGDAGAAGRDDRLLRPLSARGCVDLGAYGADPGASGLRVGHRARRNRRDRARRAGRRSARPRYRARGDRDAPRHGRAQAARRPVRREAVPGGPRRPGIRGACRAARRPHRVRSTAGDRHRPLGRGWSPATLGRRGERRADARAGDAAARRASRGGTGRAHPGAGRACAGAGRLGRGGGNAGRDAARGARDLAGPDGSGRWIME